MITAKQVRLAQKIAPQTEVTVFTMDLRAAGKGYERYAQAAMALPGVTYRWGRPAAVHELPQERTLRLLTPDGEELFDLVVLAVGLGPSPDVGELAAAAGVALDEHGFILPGADGPASTSRPGVFGCGSALTPADVPETVTQAAAAAALAANALSPAAVFLPPARPGGTSDRFGRQGERSLSRHTDAQGNEGHADISDQPPRIGLFVCTCHGALAETLDLTALADAGSRLGAVAHVEQLGAACEGRGLSAMEQAAAEHDLNRIVVAGCSPRLYTDRFETLMERLHLPARFLARANIREGAVWAHAGSTAATAAAQGALTISVAGLRETLSVPGPHPNPPPSEQGREKAPPRGTTAFFPPGPVPCAPKTGPGHAGGTSDRFGRQGGRILVLGGGLAGMTAALTLADLGIDCDVIERTAQLGGHLRELSQAKARNILHALGTNTLSPGLDAQALLSKTVARMRQAQGIRAWAEAELVGWSGVRGDFEAEIQLGDRQEHKVRRERYGALIVATGAEPATTSEYLYGTHQRVLTQIELASRIPDLQPADFQSVVMIQCVGSRDESHPYCSRVCCTRAISNALALKEHDPEIEINILFRDIRTMGMHELAYQQARRLGVRFFRYQPPDKPLVQANGDQLEVTVHDTLYDDRIKHPATITLQADLLVLSTGIAPREQDNGRLAGMLGLLLDEDRFFAEAHPKLRPTDFTQPGIHLCGMAYGPRTIEESISQARAAALRAALNVAYPAAPRHDVATVVQKLCSSCELCVTHCPYGARVMAESRRGAQRQVASVIEHLCQGCGVCVAVCPNGASRQPALEPVQVLAMVDAALEVSR
jgi:heterodisulfide reductase subunit A